MAKKGESSTGVDSKASHYKHPRILKEIMFANDKFMASQLSENIEVVPGIQLNLNDGQSVKYGGEYQTMKNQYSMKDFNEKFLSISAIDARRASAIDQYLENSGMKRDESKEKELKNNESA